MSKYKGLFTFDEDNHRYVPIAQADGIIDCMDYEPSESAEPLIKDERIRKAVRAWARMNDIRFIHMCSREDKRNARIVGQNAEGRTFTMEISDEYSVRVSFGDYKECYTIDELCGEEEE